MRKTALLLATLLAVAVVFTVRAEDNVPKKEEAKKEGAKKEEPKKTETPPAGAQQTLTGDLGVTSDGKAVLRSREDKTNKTYVLYPENADVGKTLAALAKKKAHAEVTGVVAPDGINVKVSSVTEKKDDKKKGGGGGRH